MRRKSLLLSVLTVAAMATLLSACITAPKMSYQGKLTDPAGNPVADGNYNMTFRLWGPGIPNPVVVWQETQAVAVADGLFNVTLGAVTPLTPSLFINELELGVEVNGDGEMSPRQVIYGAPYAMTLVDGAVMAGTRNLADDGNYPAMFNLFNAGDSYGLGIRFVGKAGLAITGEYLGTQYGDYGIMADQVKRGAILTATNGIGVRINATDDAGLFSEAMTYGPGAFGWGHASDGSFGFGLDGHGGSSYGVYAWSDGAGQYGGYFADPIFVNGGCTGCVFRYMARNASGGTLRPGDAVGAAGVEAGLAGMASPIIKVAPAAAGQPILGVVVGRAEVTMAGEDSVYTQPGAHFGPVGGEAAPGDYLVVVVQGPAQVQADPSASITAGTLVYLGADGVTTFASGPAIGMALDAPGPDGLVWVLVGFR